MRMGWLVLCALLGCGARTAPVAEPSDAGTPTDAPDIGMELCNGVDEDGDGRIDEAVAARSFHARVRIRVDEGTTGSCPRCRWARTVRLVPSRDGMRALMLIFDDGSSDVPNLFGRTLEPDGNPVGTWDPVFDTATQDWFPTLRRDRGGGHVLGTVVSVDRSDQLAVGRLDARGEPVLGLEPWTAVPHGLHPPDIVALADDSLLAGYKCSGAPDLCLARVGEPGATVLDPLSASTALLMRDGVAGLSTPSMHVRGDRLGMAALQVFVDETARLLFFVLDVDGRILREQALPLAPDAFRYFPYDTVHTLAADEGWFVLFSRRDPGEAGEPVGRWVARFGPGGELIEGPTSFEPDHFYYGAATHIQAHPAGGFLMSGLRALDLTAERLEEEGYVAYLDSTGRMMWDMLVRDLDHAVVLDDGRIFALINPGRTGDEPNPLDVVELSCAPI